MLIGLLKNCRPIQSNLIRLPQTSYLFKNFFFQSGHVFNSFVGSPEFPIPGTEDYEESTKRLQDPRVLEMLSTSSQTNRLNTSLKRMMKDVQKQNAALKAEYKKLAKRVEYVENRLGSQ